MTRSSGAHDTLVYRLSQVLLKLNQGESLDPQALADEFGVNLRTIQRDLNVRFASLPLLKSGGRYRMEESYLGKLTIKDVEHFASLAGVSGLFPALTERFLRDVLDSQKSNAWLVRGHHYEDLHGQSDLFAKLEQAIVEHRHTHFTYDKAPGQSKFHQQMEPYKLINQKGIWYVAAWDGDRLKSFSVTKISDLQVEQTTFAPRPQVEAELASNDSIWLGAERRKVLLRVSAQVVGYFKRRQLLPNQTIEQELPGGDLLVAATVISADEILPVARYWIPHVRIIEPPEFQHALEAGLSDYLGVPKKSKTT